MIFVGAVAIYCFLKKKTRRWAWRLFGSCFLLTIIYCINNASIVLQLFEITGEASHKNEMVINGSLFLVKEVLGLYLHGQYHAVSNHIFLLMLISISAFLAVLRYKALTPIQKMQLCEIVCLLFLAFIIALFYGFFISEYGADIRQALPGSLKAFQLNRFYWFYPALWFVAGGMATNLLWSMFHEKIHRFWMAGIVVCVCVGTIWMCRGNILFKNIIKISFPTYAIEKLDTNNFTWKSFFAEDIFDQIAQEIDPVKENYRVISIGIYPTVALYNGFYCLDGYSNNYPLTYKHTFYKVIEKELEQDEELKNYFCDWGNRCYAFSHEVKQDYTVEKDSGIKINDFKFNLEAFKDMGGRYIFSGVEIINPEQYTLKSIGAYETNQSWYRVWVYEY